MCETGRRPAGWAVVQTAKAGSPVQSAKEDEVSETKTWPHKELGKRLSNWGRWGDDDQLGTLNFVTPQKRVQAAGLVKTGKIIDLGMPFDGNGPQAGGPAGRFNPIHLMRLTPADQLASSDGLIAADDVIIMGLQCATQWDALSHVGYDGSFYNNTPASAIASWTGATRLGFAECVQRLISRGVLLDIARLKGVDRLDVSTEIMPADLSAAEERQGVQVESGDVLLIRTGHYQYFLEGDSATYRGDAPGLGVDCVEWLHEREVAAVAMDNTAVEVWPCKVEGSRIPFHMVAIRDVGLTLGEMFNLEELAADCEDDGVWEFMFCAPGLKVSNAVGSPVTPMVMK
jgi:kynurenine formamidase